jgi:hypothetical protein
MSCVVETLETLVDLGSGTQLTGKACLCPLNGVVPGIADDPESKWGAQLWSNGPCLAPDQAKLNCGSS